MSWVLFETMFLRLRKKALVRTAPMSGYFSAHCSLSYFKHQKIGSVFDFESHWITFCCRRWEANTFIEPGPCILLCHMMVCVNKCRIAKFKVQFFRKFFAINQALSESYCLEGAPNASLLQVILHIHTKLFSFETHFNNVKECCRCGLFFFYE